MWWECGECGGQIRRERQPVVCRECGRASEAFVRVSPELDADSEPHAAWIRAGVESGTFLSGANAAWAESA